VVRLQFNCYHIISYHIISYHIKLTDVVVVDFYVKLFLCYSMNDLRKTTRGRESETRDLLLVDIQDEHDDDKS
jgi:hypothetical protein